MSPNKKGKKGKAADKAAEKTKADSATSRHIEYIAYTSAKVEDDEDVSKSAVSAIAQALTNAMHSNVGEREVYGNQSGINLLQQSEKLAQVSRQIEDLQAQDRNQARQIQALQDQTRQLQDASLGYRQIRHRFLDVYRRDVRRITSPQTFTSIRSGNLRAHAGDCVTDAELYASGERDDAHIFVHIYGLDYQKVRQLAASRNETAIQALNDYGTHEADTESTIPENVRAAFTHFCNQLSDQPSKSLDRYEPSEHYRSYLNYYGSFQAWRQAESTRRRAQRDRPQTVG